jgi:hypothetical protein
MEVAALAVVVVDGGHELHRATHHPHVEVVVAD